jgi:uncharacterized phage-associated protein
MGAPQIDSIDLAKYILADQGPMPHLKLQKLIYYVEAWHLVIFDDPLITDRFKAWMHGPVSTKVWHEFKNESPLLTQITISARDKTRAQLRVTSQLTAEQLSLIDSVMKEYGPLNAYELEGLTHSEQPWVEARAGLSPAEPSTATISRDTMRKFYRQRLYGANAAA